MSDGKISGGVWKNYVATADKFNDPGRFSAIIGYEWTSTPGGNNLHRNILYRDGAELAVQKENTRAAIFDAMMRREVYATTGPRIALRFFGGWDFESADARSSRLAAIGYRKGVPMGGDLTQAPKGRAPRFLLSAVKDPLSGNLDRIQIVKGWLDKHGQTQEKVFDVVWSGGRKLDRKGKLPAVGNTVNVADASWSNSIGAPELTAVWQDPEFDSGQRAFYYARVIEIPTPRWNLYDQVRYGQAPDPQLPATTRERAYSSPIWYTP